MSAEIIKRFNGASLVGALLLSLWLFLTGIDRYRSSYVKVVLNTGTREFPRTHLYRQVLPVHSVKASPLLRGEKLYSEFQSRPSSTWVNTFLYPTSLQELLSLPSPAPPPPFFLYLLTHLHPPDSKCNQVKDYNSPGHCISSAITMPDT